MMETSLDAYEIGYTVVVAGDGCCVLREQVQNVPPSRRTAISAGRRMRPLAGLASPAGGHFADHARTGFSRLQWDIWLNGDSLNAAVAQGKVTLTGTTGSAIAKDRAFDDAWVNGVLSVDVSGLKVEPDTADGRTTKADLKPDSEIQSAIQTALPLDPRVAAFARDITVSVEGGVVILWEVANMRRKAPRSRTPATR